MIFLIKLKISSHRSQWGASLPSTHLKNSCPLQWQLPQFAKERCISTPICISEDNVLQPEVIFTTGLSWLDGLAMFQLSYPSLSTTVHSPHPSPDSFISFHGATFRFLVQTDIQCFRYAVWWNWWVMRNGPFIPPLSFSLTQSPLSFSPVLYRNISILPDFSRWVVLMGCCILPCCPRTRNDREGENN